MLVDYNFSMSFVAYCKNKRWDIYHAVRNWYPIWYFILNRSARSDWKKYRPRANLMESQIAETLIKDGIVVSSFSELFPDINFKNLGDFAKVVSETLKVREDFLAHREMIAERINAGSVRKGSKKYLKDFVVEPWGSTGNNLIPDAGNPFIRVSVHERVLTIAGLYMNIMPRFRAYHLRFNLPVPAGTVEYFSQRWHRDPEDHRMFKVFIYMTDVMDVAAGPFMYVKGSQPGGHLNRLFPQRPPASTYPELGAVEKEISHGDIKICLGNAGTVIFADTSGLHKGGYTTANPRLMYTATYFSDAALYRSFLKHQGTTDQYSVLQKSSLSLQ